MKMNQWVDFDTGDKAQSENVFSYMGKTYSIELRSEERRVGKEC